MTAGCEQLCTNADGFYNCSCHTGYTLNVDGLTCHDTGTCRSELLNYAPQESTLLSNT